MSVRIFVVSWSAVLAMSAIVFSQQVQPAQPRNAPREQPRVLPREPAQAQPVQPDRAQPARNVVRQGSGQQQGQVSQGDVAQWLTMGNQAEIELGKLAQEKSKNQQVREFAAMMIKDHTAFSQRLQKFAGQQAQGERGQAQGGSQSWMDLGRQAAQFKLNMTKEMLSKYDGQDFDMGYLGQQIGAHVEMLACLTAAKNVGDQNFQQAIEDGIQTTREHLQQAQQLAHKLEDQEGADVQRRTPQGTGPRGGTARPDVGGASDVSGDRNAEPRSERGTITPDDRPREEVPQRAVP